MTKNHTWITASVGEWEKELLSYSGVVTEGGFVLLLQ
jgi:hypothetical protein